MPNTTAGWLAQLGYRPDTMSLEEQMTDRPRDEEVLYPYCHHLNCVGDRQKDLTGGVYKPSAKGQRRCPDCGKQLRYHVRLKLRDRGKRHEVKEKGQEAHNRKAKTKKRRKRYGA